MTTTPMTPNDSLNQEKKKFYQMFFTVIMLLIKSYAVFYLRE